MRNKVFALIFVCMLSVTAYAQFRTGVKGGINISSINMNMGGVELEIYEPRMGVNGGIMAEYMFNSHLGLQTEINYFYSGAEINSANYTKGMELPAGLSLEGYVDMHTFQLPVYLKTKFSLAENLKLYAMGGGFATFTPSAYQHINYEYESESMKVKWSLFDDKIRILDNEEGNVYMQQRWNVGLAAEVGFELNERVVVGAGFRHVLNNMAAFGYMIGGSALKPTTKMWTASLTAGYFF